MTQKKLTYTGERIISEIRQELKSIMQSLPWAIPLDFSDDSDDLMASKSKCFRKGCSHGACEFIACVDAGCSIFQIKARYSDLLKELSKLLAEKTCCDAEFKTVEEEALYRLGKLLSFQEMLKIASLYPIGRLRKITDFGLGRHYDRGLEKDPLITDPFPYFRKEYRYPKDGWIKPASYYLDEAMIPQDTAKK